VSFNHKCRICGEYINGGNKYGICTVRKECRDAREAVRDEIVKFTRHMKIVAMRFVAPDGWYSLSPADRAVLFKEIKAPWETG
jgi:hypothetical protein